MITICMSINNAFTTIDNAHNAVRTINRSMVANISVYLKRGDYVLGSIFTLSKVMGH